MGIKRALLCVAVGGNSLPESLSLVAQESSQADVIEIRLDSLEDQSPDPFVRATDTPLLFTNRPDWEGGFFSGPEEKRISYLLQAIELGAAYVDCELRAPVSSRDRIRDASAGTATRTIFSWHDFNLTPDRNELTDIVGSMHEAGADIGKIVTTAQDHFDVLKVLALQETAAELNFPLIAFCMGGPGVISRLATVELGGYMTYCAPAGFSGTAPGQLSSNYLRAMLDLLK